MPSIATIENWAHRVLALAMIVLPYIQSLHVPIALKWVGPAAGIALIIVERLLAVIPAGARYHAKAPDKVLPIVPTTPPEPPK